MSKEDIADVVTISKTIIGDLKGALKKKNQTSEEATDNFGFKGKGFKSMFKEAKEGIKKSTPNFSPKELFEDFSEIRKGLKDGFKSIPPPKAKEYAQAPPPRPTEAKTREYYCKVLGVPLDASKQVINDRFRELAVMYHPDRMGAESAASVFREIKEARDRLLE